MSKPRQKKNTHARKRQLRRVQKHLLRFPQDGKAMKDLWRIEGLAK